MKALYLAGSIIFTTLILVLAFENINAQCSQINFLFYDVRFSPTFIILVVSVIGIVTGALYHAFLGKIFESAEDEENEDF